MTPGVRRSAEVTPRDADRSSPRPPRRPRWHEEPPRAGPAARPRRGAAACGLRPSREATAAAVTPLGATAANAPFLTNGAGRSLYAFKNDVPAAGATPPTSNCITAPCTDSWALWEKPAALANVVLPSTIPAADVTSFTSLGVQQFVYKGWPLYFFKADDAPGKVAGNSIANWHAINGAWNGVYP